LFYSQQRAGQTFPLQMPASRVMKLSCAATANMTTKTHPKVRSVTMVPLTFDRTSSSFAMMESAQAADTKGLLIKRQLQQGTEKTTQKTC
jgi:hypothetical protein